MTIRTLLSAMLLVVIAALAIPACSAIGERRDAIRVVAIARAGQSVFAALQYLRPERGSVQAGLTAPAPAETALMDRLAATRAKAAVAFEAVMRDCVAARCADDDPQLTAFDGSLQRLISVRRDTDAAMRLSPSARAPGLSASWAAATTDILNRFDRISGSLTERVRLVDPVIAKLMTLKQIGWMVRDSAGLERNVYSDAINSSSLPPEARVRMALYRGIIVGGWGLLRDLTARPGAPAIVVAAMHGATADFFGSYEKQRTDLAANMVSGRPAGVTLAAWLQVSTKALDSLIQIANAAVAETQSHAERRAVDADHRLWLQAGLLANGILLGSGGIFLAQKRIITPILVMSTVMRRLAQGDLSADIGHGGRRDEVGDMIGAVIVFRDGMVQAERLEAEHEDMRQRATLEKQAALQEMATTIETESSRAMEAVGTRTATMAATAEEMSASAARTGESAQGAAGAAAEVQAKAQTVASAAEQLAASIREIGAQVGLSTTMAGRAVVAGNEARVSMDALNQQVGKIGVVADMISEIAAKTNLLALNATIEAARAGDAGRGFAVVAKEVKQMATQNARSTQEIARHISEMRSAAGVSVGAVARIEQTIGDMNVVASSISEAAEEQSAATAEIARNVNGTATAADEMTRRINEVSTEAERTGHYSDEVRDGTMALNNVVDELAHAVIKMVRTSTAEVNRREHDRHEVNLACRLFVGGAVHSARIADLSTGGAAVVGASALRPGVRGTLEADQIAMKLPFTVAEASANLVRLVFDLDATECDRLEQLLERVSAKRAA